MEARSTKQVHGSKKQKLSSETINLAVEKIFPGSSTNTCMSKKNIPTGSRKHTSKSPIFFVTLGPKKILVRSKKHVQVQKKGAQVQKTCIPKKSRPPRGVDHKKNISIPLIPPRRAPAMKRSNTKPLVGQELGVFHRGMGSTFRHLFKLPNSQLMLLDSYLPFSNSM